MRRELVLPEINEEHLKDDQEREDVAVEQGLQSTEKREKGKEKKRQERDTYLLETVIIRKKWIRRKRTRRRTSMDGLFRLQYTLTLCILNCSEYSEDKVPMY